jgi:hypothetical protein
MYACFLVVALVLSGCGKSAEQKKLQEAAKQANQAGEVLKEGAEKMADAFKGLSGDGTEGKKVEPVNFRELKALLPESLPGLKRTSAEGEKTSAFGVKVSEAHASYDNEEGANVSVKITDMGSVSGLMGMATLGWAYADVDRETDEGYEKTTTFKGHKALEKYSTESKNGELSIFVAGRFIVNVEGSNVEMSYIKEVAGKIDLGALESMKDSGVTS